MGPCSRTVGTEVQVAQAPQRERRGVARERIVAHAGRLTDELAEIDLLLPTVPSPDLAALCDALWMGVAVAPLPTALAASLELDFLTASASESYASCATRVAQDHTTRAQLRADLRQRMTSSPLCQSRPIADKLEAIYASELDRAHRAAQPCPWRADDALRLHVGGAERKEGWTVINIRPGSHVDMVGDIRELDAVAEGTVAEIYASHILEHLSYGGLTAALNELHRVLAPGGRLRISVPDLEKLSRMYVQQTTPPVRREQIMTLMFGDQIDDHDFHKIGLDAWTLRRMLRRAGFRRAHQQSTFNVFDDSSNATFTGQPFSLNLVAYKTC